MNENDSAFKRQSKESFNLKSEAGRIACLDYLQSWYDFVVNKAKSCTSALEKCTAGVSSLKTNADGKAVEVTYGKYENGKIVTGACTVAPTLGVNNCIRKIAADKPKSGNDDDGGRTYTITYGAKDKTHDLKLLRGDRGNDGSPGAWGGVYFKNGMKAIDPSATGFSASFKVISPSVTGVSGGATAFSLSASIVNTKTGIKYRCRTGIGFDSDAANNECHMLAAHLAVMDANVEISDAVGCIADIKKSAAYETTGALQSKVKGIQTKIAGVKTAINTMKAQVFA